MVHIGKIPVHLLGVYLSWFHGVDLQKLTNRQTFWRWRRDLLKYGVDIKKTPSNEFQLEGVFDDAV